MLGTVLGCTLCSVHASQLAGCIHRAVLPGVLSSTGCWRLWVLLAVLNGLCLPLVTVLAASPCGWNVAAPVEQEAKLWRCVLCTEGDALHGSRGRPSVWFCICIHVTSRVSFGMNEKAVSWPKGFPQPNLSMALPRTLSRLGVQENPPDAHTSSATCCKAWGGQCPFPPGAKTCLDLGSIGNDGLLENVSAWMLRLSGRYLENTN